MTYKKIRKHMQHPLIDKLLKTYLKCTYFCESFCMSLLLVFIRLWMAQIFWYSGLLKFENWPSTLYLMEYEYKITFVPISLAAGLSTLFELLCPILLTLGLGSRLATIPLFFMTFLIQLTYPEFVEHKYWAMLLGIILFYGPGRFSLDYIMKRNYIK